MFFAILSLHLSINGSIIWDMAGNLNQWVNNTITGTNEPNSGVAGWDVIELNAITNWGSMTQSTVGAASTAWTSAQYIGQLETEDTTDATAYGIVRGGNWSSQNDAGVEGMNLNDAVGIPGGSYLGFRCAL